MRGHVISSLAGSLACVALLGVVAVALAEPKPNLPAVPPRTPADEVKTFHLPPGLRAELVASEPNIVDPVAITFDEDGRLYVAEMLGYPNGGVGTGPITSGKIIRLEDRDGDGFYETATTFAEGLRFPTSMMAYRGGLLVSIAPDLVYFKDTDGDGKADERRTLYTGFGIYNIQQMLNSLQWGLDNWVYGCDGINPSKIVSLEKPELPAIELRGRGIRFHPDVPGSLEPISGGGQFGMVPDDWQHWFTNTNNQHLRHIVLPDHYLRRNPDLAVAAVTLDIPDHGAACKVFRLSPYESWRVERTRRRREGTDARRFPSTELVPGGFITSACSPVIYTADRLPAAFRGQSYICDPANNLIHRDALEPNGATFTAKRVDVDSEFLASTDNWFRPVNLSIGPDGALYVVDFYREVIETPLSLPEDIKQALNLQSRGRGRIWRIVPEGAGRSEKPQLSQASAEELAGRLASPNPWWRLTAQRLLIERQAKVIAPLLARLVSERPTPQARAHALWTLEGLGCLDPALIETALNDAEPGVREQALRLAEPRLAASPTLQAAVSRLADDPSGQVRFQLAFTLGAADSAVCRTTLTRLARRDVTDPWTQVAILSSSRSTAYSLLRGLLADDSFLQQPTDLHLQFLTRLSNLVGAHASNAELAAVFDRLTHTTGHVSGWSIAILEGLGEGLANRRQPFSALWHQAPADLREGLEKLRPFFTLVAARARDDRAPLAERVRATRLLGYGPDAEARPVLQALLLPQVPTDLQLAAIRALSQHSDPQVAESLLAGWSNASPAIRREVLEALFSRSDRVPHLLAAIEAKKVLAGQMEPFRIEQLKKHPDAAIRQRAQAALAGQIATDRQQIVDRYKPALEMRGDPARGKAVFQKTCATCHRLENVGTEVGPDLLSALKTKTAGTLLIDLFDPSREVDPRYLNYVVSTKDGRIFTGLIAAETSSSITLRRAERAEDTLLRSQIEEIQGTAKSLMPENLETQVSQQDVADVIAYLLHVVGPKSGG